MGRVRTMAVRRHARIVPPERGQVLVTASIGPAQELIAVWAATPADREALRARTTSRTGAGPTFALTRPERPVPVVVTVQTDQRPDDVGLRVRVPGLEVAHVAVQPLPNGRTLLVGGRCRLLASGPEHNAVIVSDEGQTVRTGVLGDGIEHLLTTSGGDIWAGYFDEGVFGNRGWGESGAESEPIGSPGLVRFDQELTATWRFPEDAALREGPPPIHDCYALNVTDDAVWAHYYSDFPVVRIRPDGQVRTWSTDVAGAHALLAGSQRVALAGGYGDDRNRLITAGLGSDRISPASRLELRLPRERTLVARGPHLHVLTETDWYRLDLDELA